MTPTVLQINHPGRQSPRSAGNRGLFDPAVAPSAIPLDFGAGVVQRFLRGLAFGSPHELTTNEVGDIIEKFVQAAKLAYDSGFRGVEVHAAHGYLLAQFMSSRTNTRTDQYGGSAANRAEPLVQIIHGIRAATSPSFCIGLKLNSTDVSHSGDTTEDFIEQLQLCVDCGIDFLEISGGTYENPTVSKSFSASTPMDWNCTNKGNVRCHMAFSTMPPLPRAQALYVEKPSFFPSHPLFAKGSHPSR